MVQITKGQHYVWRWYLTNWSTANRVCVRSLHDKLEFITDPAKILKERFFYEFPILKENELYALSSYLESISGPSSKDLKLLFLEMFEKIFLLKDVKNETEVNALLRNGLEGFYTKIESYGNKLVQCSTVDDLQKVLKEGKDEAFVYLVIQYLRTRKMRNNLRASHNLSGNLGHAVEILSPIIVANDIVCSNIHNVSIKILSNESQQEFLTSDQPAYNISNKIDDKGEYLGFEIYYPINPSLAVKTDFMDNRDEIIVERCDERALHNYNRKTIENAERYIIGRNNKSLMPYFLK